MGCKPSKGESDRSTPPDLRGALRYIEQEADKILAQDTGYVSALMLIREIARRAALQQSAPAETLMRCCWCKKPLEAETEYEYCPYCRGRFSFGKPERAAPPAGGEPPRGGDASAKATEVQPGLPGLPSSAAATDPPSVVGAGGPASPGCRVMDAWEEAEGESMREGPRYTLERLVDDAVCAAEAAARRAAFEEVERIAQEVPVQLIPDYSGEDVVWMTRRNIVEVIRERARREEGRE